MRVIFLGSPVASPPSSLSATEKFEHSWFNTGNLAIGDSILRELVVTDYAAAPWPEQLPFDPVEASEKYDQIVIPAFNFLYRGFDFGRFADFIEKTTLPCVMVGVGAQAPSPGAYDLDIPEGTRRLLSIASERSRSIGVRGEFSADVMGRLGYKNVNLMGCPSLYRTLAPTISVPRRQRSPSDSLRVVVNGSRNVSDHSFAPEEMNAFEAMMIDLAIDKGWPHVLQNEQPELDIVLRDGEAAYQNLADLGTLTGRLSLTHGSGDWLRDIQSRYHIFFSIDRWEKFLKLFDFSLGTRLHGAILALTSGVPALLINHDTRTSEMAKLCRLPHLSVADVKNVDVDILYDGLELGDFEKRYCDLYQNYVNFLDENNLRHRLISEAPDSDAPHANERFSQVALSSWDRMIQNAKTTDALAVARSEIAHLTEALARGQAVIDERGVRIAELETDISNKIAYTSEALAKGQAVIDERGVRIAELEADISDKIAYASDVLAKGQAVIDGQGVRIAELEANLSDKLANAADALAKGQAVIDERGVRIAELESKSAKDAEAIAASQAEAARLVKTTASVTAWGHNASHKLRMSEQELSEARSQLAMISHERDAILTSTSWQAVKPLRAIAPYFPSGLRRFIRRSLRLVWWTVTLQLFSKLRQRRYFLGQSGSGMK